MVGQRIEKLAKLCVHYSVKVKPRETVVTQGSVLALPLMRELYKECLLSDAYPQIMPLADVQYAFYPLTKEHQLQFVSPFDGFLFENVDVRIAIL